MKPMTKMEIETILASDDVPYWVKDTIRLMMIKDPVDVLHGVSLLNKVAKMLND